MLTFLSINMLSLPSLWKDCSKVGENTENEQLGDIIMLILLENKYKNRNKTNAEVEQKLW